MDPSASGQPSAGGEPQEVVVRRVGEEGAELAVFEFQGTLRDLMLSSLNKGYLATGRYAPHARAISPQGARSLAVAGSAAGMTALSALASPTLFMATANPATLMTIGGGVGSAVMGTGGIVGQAAFIPVAASLPVVAPILAMQALSTAVIMDQFKQVHRRLDAIKATLNTVIARSEATLAGELLAAARVVDDVYRQYECDGSFSTDMLMRLSLAERDVGALAARFHQLVGARDVTEFGDLSEVQQGNYDAHGAMLASLVELRVAYLRVCVDMQENPRSVASSIAQLRSLLGERIAFWQELQHRSEPIDAKVAELQAKLAKMNWTDSVLPGDGPGSVQRSIAQLKDAQNEILKSERDIVEQFHSLIESAKSTQAALDAAQPASGETSPTLVYWHDEAGEHAFVTDEKLELIATDNPRADGVASGL